MAESQENPVAFVMNIASQTMVGQGIGIGSYLGIFDLIATLEVPETYKKIAELGKWKPRYIKEWLNLMVCGRIVKYNAIDETYFLPEPMRPVVSTCGKSHSVGTFMEIFNVIGIPIRKVSDCFPLNGPIGVPYSSYTGYREWQGRFRDVTLEWKDLNLAYHLIPGLVKKLEAGIEVCDGGCNDANHIILTAQHYSKSKYLGFDISEEMLNVARDVCKNKKLENITFEYQDGCNMPAEWSDRFDVFTAFDVVHDIPFPKLFLKEVMRVIKPGGVLLMVDINLHSNVENNIENSFASTFYGISLLHCLPISLSVEGSDGLGNTWGIEAQKQYLVKAGFENISKLDHTDVMNVYFLGYKPKKYFTG